jgi:hypothetical protein
MLVVLVMAAATLGAGCGGATTTVQTMTATPRPGTSTAAVSQPKPSEAGHTSSAAAEANHEEARTVPDETHVRLDAAERDLERRGVSFRVLGGGSSGLSPKSAWTVCETNPAPRTHLESGTTIRLIVGRSCRSGTR